MLELADQELGSQSPADVHGLELVESCQDTGTSHSSQDVGSGSLHHGHEAFVLQNLDSAVDRSLVLDTAAGVHHHTSPDGVNGVGHQSGSDGDDPAQQEGETHIGSVAQEEGLQSVEHTEVHTAVDEDTDSRDGEASVETLDTVRLEGLGVDIDETVELPLASLALGVIGQPGSGVVQRVDEQQRAGSGHSSAQDVHGELLGLAGVLGGGEGNLDGVFEGEVQGLGGEVSEDVGQVSSPEGIDSLGGEETWPTSSDTGVGLVQTALLDHLVLVLDQQLHSLDGGSHGLGHTGGHTGQHEVFKEPELLGITHAEACLGMSWSLVRQESTV